MTMKRNPRRRSTKAKLMSTNTLYLLVAMTTAVSAFNSQTPTISGETSLRSHGNGMYPSRVRSSPSISVSLLKTEGNESVRTRLQFSDDTSSDTTIDSGWWRKLFTVSSRLQNRSTTTSSSSERSVGSEIEEQQNVDAYLEFLDKRYRRLHCDDTKDEQRDSSASKNGKPFSAMDWLTTGGNENAHAITTSREQQADALYVLGVAGLASQKLLQKHSLPTTEASALEMGKSVESEKKTDTTSMKIQTNEMFVKNFLLPIVRVIYLIQRQKMLFLKAVRQKVTDLVSKVTSALGPALSRSPRSIFHAILGIGGGRENILRTIGIGYATIVVFRPLLQAVFAEGLAFDPLIQ